MADSTHPPGIVVDTVGWPAAADLLRVARLTPHCTVLGPGTRAVIWLQGCPFRCAGCVAPEWILFEGGTERAVDDVAEWLVCLDRVEGVTLSGGEPFAQARALVRLLDRVRERRQLSVMSYSGYKIEQLRRGTEEQQQLLARLDILVDGPYIQEWHTNLRWRGSSNQRVHFLTDTYGDLSGMVREEGVDLEFEVLPSGEVAWMGIPPMGFRREVTAPLTLRRRS